MDDINDRLKTCNNCKHYHNIMADPMCELTYYHFHQWCDLWSSIIPVTKISDEEFAQREQPWYDDIETGQACCWRFEDSGIRGVLSDKQMKELLQINITDKDKECEDNG